MVGVGPPLEALATNRRPAPIYTQGEFWDEHEA